MQAFIVRPFGTKNEVNFDKVEELLIQPALKELKIDGATTAKIVEAGNIREDMFAQLLLADLVIADLSIHNANVFYELGLRHALRDKKTFLLRCSKDEIPFDLKTDRYLTYDAAKPAEQLPALVEGLRATMLSDRVDSPIFFMLPQLKAQDPERILVIPYDFVEEVEIAKAGKQVGKLALLASEAEEFPWALPAMRTIGEALYCLKAFELAQQSWEKVRDRFPADVDANDRLATIYQRLAESSFSNNPVEAWELLAKSDLALKRLMDGYKQLDRNRRAEIYSLMGRNAKSKWIEAWKKTDDKGKQTIALQSSFLLEAFNDYYRGFTEDLNHFYSGINALGMLTVLTSLAQTNADVWAASFDTDEAADAQLKQYKTMLVKLSDVVQASIAAQKKRMVNEGQSDPWLNMTEADFSCLTVARPPFVFNLYKKVIDEANDLNFDAAKRQLLLYQQLGVMPENVTAALSAFGSDKIKEQSSNCNYLLFTGHMIDRPGREQKRFPPEKESAVRAAIKEMVEKEMAHANNSITGIAGGACGGDILFHEICEELSIPTELYLALPYEKFVVESVEFAGAGWIERFNDLYQKLPKHALSQTKDLPNWLQKKKNYSIWERNNLWMLESALACGGLHMSLIALWDGKGGDGVGGTEHMVKKAQERGAKTVVIDMNAFTKD